VERTHRGGKKGGDQSKRFSKVWFLQFVKRKRRRGGVHKTIKGVLGWGNEAGSRTFDMTWELAYRASARETKPTDVIVVGGKGGGGVGRRSGKSSSFKRRNMLEEYKGRVRTCSQSQKKFQQKGRRPQTRWVV